jgi:hypothetical protein
VADFPALTLRLVKSGFHRLINRTFSRFILSSVLEALAIACIRFERMQCRKPSDIPPEACNRIDCTMVLIDALVLVARGAPPTWSGLPIFIFIAGQN